MPFAVGDKVVHPGHGPGRITGEKRQELVAGFLHYYVIEIPFKALIVHVPVRKMDELGVRPAMSRAKLARVFDTLRDSPRRLPEDHKKRQEQVWEILRTGQPIKIAEVVRDLSWHRQAAHLTKKDTDLLARARQFLAAEIALVTDAEITDVNKEVDAALAVAMARESEEAHAQEVAVPSQP